MSIWRAWGVVDAGRYPGRRARAVPRVGPFGCRNRTAKTVPPCRSFEDAARRRAASSFTPVPSHPPPMTSVPTTSLTHLQRLGSREHPYPARGRRRGRQPGDALLHRQGQRDDAAPGDEGLPSGGAALPLLHVDTRLEVPRHVQFATAWRARPAWTCWCNINPEGVEKDINPSTHGSAIHTDIMKTEGLKRRRSTSTASTRPSAARAATRRSRAPRSASSPSAPASTAGTRRTSARAVALYNAPKQRASRSACSRCRTGPSSTSGNTSTCENIPIVPLYFAAGARWSSRDGTLIMVDDDRMPLRPARRRDEEGALPHARLLSAHRRDRESQADTLPAIIQEMLLTTTSSARGGSSTHDAGRLDGKKEAGGYF